MNQKQKEQYEKASQGFLKMWAKFILRYKYSPKGVLVRYYSDGPKLEMGVIEIFKATEDEIETAKSVLNDKKAKKSASGGLKKIDT